MDSGIANDGTIQLACKRCRAAIDPSEVNVALGVAKCTECQTVFSFADQLIPATATAAITRAEVPLPPRIQVTQWGEELQVTWRWFRWPTLFLVFFCIVWDGFLVFWYSMALGAQGTIDSGAGLLIMLLFPLVHVAVGMGLTYFTVACLFNTTLLRVAGGILTIRHRPIPWRGNQDITASDIEQVYCTEKAHHSKNGTNYTYDVNAMLIDGRKVRLVGGFEESDQALYLEQTIENHLAIQDRPVGGELPRT